MKKTKNHLNFSLALPFLQVAPAKKPAAQPASPKPSPTQSKKPFIIGLIALGAVLLLSLLVFFGQQFVGKAIQFTPPGEFAGAGAINKIDLPLARGERLTVQVGATLPAGAESVAYSFQLDYPHILRFIAVDSSLDEWGSTFQRSTPAPNSNSITFEHATIDPHQALSAGSYQLATVTFEAVQDITTQEQLAGFQFADIDVLSMSSTPIDFFPDGSTSFTAPTGQARCPDFTDEDGVTWFNALDTNALPQAPDRGDPFNADKVTAFCAAKNIRPGGGCVALLLDQVDDDEIMSADDKYVIGIGVQANINTGCGAENQLACPFDAGIKIYYACDNYYWTTSEQFPAAPTCGTRNYVVTGQGGTK